MRLARPLLAVAALFVIGRMTSPASAAEATPEPRAMAVECSPIAAFDTGSDKARFGQLLFVGGMTMTSPAADFGSFSSFRFRTPGRDFAGVSDTGFWYFGSVVRDGAGVPTCFEAFRMQRFVGADGAAIEEKFDSDAEGIDIDGDIATVSFERRHRIVEYRLDPDHMGAAAGEVPFLVPRRELRQNKGFETVVHAPADGPLAGARLIVAERSIDRQGNSFAAVLEGPLKGVFTVARHDDFDITDGAFLPDGDLLLLERYFSVLTGVRMRLRRIEATSIHPGGVADGDILLTADMDRQIDNMEGLDVWRRADGATMISVVSDDNQSFLQRNLYLEFELVED